MLNRQGRYQESADRLAGVRHRVEAYAGSDPQLREIVQSLAAEAPAYSAAMPEMDRKMRHFAASNASRMRTGDGKSMRRP